LGLLTELGAVFPEQFLFDYIRYSFVGLWVAYDWPAAGIKLRLFRREAGKQ